MMAHGLMFHRFHDGNKHIPGQGSLTADEFAMMLEKYASRYRLLSAEKWLEKALEKRLEDDDACVTFDDGSKGQFDIALPVIESLHIKAFWFIYSSPLEKIPGKADLYWYYRFKMFEDVQDFYDAFKRAVAGSNYSAKVNSALKTFKPEEYLKEFPFYTVEDRIFRYVRDKALGRAHFCEIMDKMVDDAHLTVDSDLLDLLWMDKACLKTLGSKGHIIGLHSHTHPTELASLDDKEQLSEYTKNHAMLKYLLGNKPILTMAHPCNSYNETTLRIIRELGVKIGFRSNMYKTEHNMLEFSRLDNTYLMHTVRPQEIHAK